MQTTQLKEKADLRNKPHTVKREGRHEIQHTVKREGRHEIQTTHS